MPKSPAPLTWFAGAGRERHWDVERANARPDPILARFNNLKLARYKEIFPAPAKTDAIDARRVSRRGQVFHQRID